METIEDGIAVETMGQERDRVFEFVFAVDIPTEPPRIGFTVETIFSPLQDDTEVELELELNLTWLEPEKTGGWVESHSLRPRDRGSTEVRLRWSKNGHLPS